MTSGAAKSRMLEQKRFSHTKHASLVYSIRVSQRSAVTHFGCGGIFNEF